MVYVTWCTFYWCYQCTLCIILTSPSRNLYIDPAIVKIACIRIAIVVTFEVLNMTIEIMSGALRGLGNPMISTVLCIVFTCALRLAWIFIIFARVQTFQSVLVVYPVSWAVTSASIVIAYLVVKRRNLLCKPESTLAFFLLQFPLK